MIVSPRPFNVALLFVLIVMGCGGPENFGENREAALLVVNRGGTVRLQNVGYPVDSPAQIPTDEVLVTEVNLAEKSFQDADLQKLKPLSELEVLNLYGTQVTNDGMSSIVEIKGLKTLELSYTAITDEGLNTLTESGSLKELEELYLYGTDVSQEAVDAFQAKYSGVKVLR